MRVTNPSPYMFHLEFPEAVVTGASPEVLVRLDGRRVDVRPLAGTRRRGRSVEETKPWKRNCARIPKELAEHVMLIDLAQRRGSGGGARQRAPGRHHGRGNATPTSCTWFPT